MISVTVAAAAVISDSVAGAAAAVTAGAGEVVAVAVHVAGIAGLAGHLGVIGRVVLAGALVRPVVRLGWRLARWGAAPLGEDQ